CNNSLYKVTTFQSIKYRYACNYHDSPPLYISFRKKLSILLPLRLLFKVISTVAVQFPITVMPDSIFSYGQPPALTIKPIIRVIIKETVALKMPVTTCTVNRLLTYKRLLSFRYRIALYTFTALFCHTAGVS